MKNKKEKHKVAHISR